MKVFIRFLALCLVLLSFSSCGEKKDPLFYQKKCITATLTCQWEEGAFSGELFLTPEGDARLTVREPAALCGAVFEKTAGAWQGRLQDATFSFAGGFLPGDRLIALFRLQDLVSLRGDTLRAPLEGRWVEVQLENELPAVLRTDLWGGMTVFVREMTLS